MKHILAIMTLVMGLPLMGHAQTITVSKIIAAGGNLELDSLPTTGGDHFVLMDSATERIRHRVLARADLFTALAYEDEVNTFTQTNIFTPNQTFSADIAVNGGDITSSGVLTIRPTGNLTLDPTGDVILAADGLDLLPATGYTYNIGALTNKFLTLHAAELWVETLVAQNTIATIGGRVLVGPTTVLTSDLTNVATSIVVKHNQMVSGDRVYMEANGSLEFMAITSAPSGSGPYTYTVTRNLDGSGANTWTAGDAVFNTGTTGKGFIDLYSTSGVISGTGPTIAFNIRTGTTYNQIATRGALGELNGLYGYATSTYGAAFGDPTDENITIDPANGFRVRSGTTTIMQLTGTSLSLSSGATSIDPNGIRIVPGTTSFDIAKGYTFSTGDPTPAGLYGRKDSGVDQSIGLVNWTTSGTPVLTIGLQAINAVATYADIAVIASPSEAHNYYRAQKHTFSSTFWNGVLSLTDLLEIKNSTSNPGMPWIRSDGSTAGINGNTTLRLNPDVNGTVFTNNMRFVPASGSPLATSYAGILEFWGVGSSPVTAYTWMGDGSGWRWEWYSRAASTSTLRFVFDDRGRIGIGGNVPAHQLELSTDDAFKPTTSTWGVISDRRSKKNVKKLPSELSQIRRLNLISYEYNGTFGTPNGDSGVGAIADEVATIFPGAVRTVTPDSKKSKDLNVSAESYQTLDWHTIFVANVKATQELAAEVERLQRELASLRK